MRVVRIVLIAMSAILSLVTCHLVSTGVLLHVCNILTPTFIKDGLALLFPIHELQASYHILDEFILEEGLLQEQVARLFFITFHIQIGIGYLGIDFLKREQERRNQLVRMDLTDTSNDDNVDDDGTTSSEQKTKDDQQQLKTQAAMNKKSLRFQKTAAPFIFFTAVPYMFKVIGYGNLNAFAYSCFKDDVHRAIRLYDLFEHDNNLVALAEHSAKAPAGTQNHGRQPPCHLVIKCLSPSHFSNDCLQTLRDTWIPLFRRVTTCSTESYLACPRYFCCQWSCPSSPK
jgi:hypothetical protein